MPRADQSLNPQQFAAVVNNIRRMRESAPEHIVAQGREWYPQAHEDAIYHSQRIGQRSGNNGAAVGAGMISALSPQTAWMLNRMQAIQMHELTPEHEAALRSGDRSMLAGSPLSYSDTPRILKAFDIMHGREHPREGLRTVGERLVRRGPDGKPVKDEDGRSIYDVARHPLKTYNFQHNIEDPDAVDPVTIDTHALKAALGAGRTKDPREVQLLQRPERYASFSDAYQTARQHAGDPTAGATQAVVWMHQLHMYPNAQPDPGLKFLGTRWDPREHGLHLPSDLSIYGRR